MQSPMLELLGLSLMLPGLEAKAVVEVNATAGIICDVAVVAAADAVADGDVAIIGAEVVVNLVAAWIVMGIR